MAGCAVATVPRIAKPEGTARANADNMLHEAHQLIQHILSSDSYYDILKIDKDDRSVDLVRNQYIKMSRLIHPDKHGDNPQATVAFQKLAKAYETLRHPQSRKVYDLQGQGLGLNTDDALTDLIKHIYKEFYDGEFNTLLEFVDRINAEHPELHIERNLVEQVLLDTRKLVEDVDKLLSDVHGDLSSVAETFGRMQAMRYMAVVGRTGCLVEMTWIVLCLPLRVVKLPMPQVVSHGWDSLCRQVGALSSYATSLPRQACLATYMGLLHLWTVVAAALWRICRYFPSSRLSDNWLPGSREPSALT